MQQTVKLVRFGSCNNCGDCCKLLIFQAGVSKMKICEQYIGSAEGHCKIYSNRPAKCQAFPVGPWDLAALPHCGFQFVDAETGKVIDGYMLMSTGSRLRQAQEFVRRNQT